METSGSLPHKRKTLLKNSQLELNRFKGSLRLSFTDSKTAGFTQRIGSLAVQLKTCSVHTWAYGTDCGWKTTITCEQKPAETH